MQKVAQSARVEIYCPLEQKSPNDTGIKHAKDITQIYPRTLKIAP